jgi:hypothetical protein
MPDIFISYSSKNQEAAESVAHALESAGATCWIAPRDIRPGSDYGEEIIKGITDSTMVVLVFSEYANASKHVLREVDRAINADKIIVPLRLDQSFPSGGMDYRLCTVQWVEAEGFPFPPKAISDTLSVLNAATKRDLPTIATTIQVPEYVILNRCSRCGGQYAEHDPSGCSFHPSPPENIGHTGPDRDYSEIWQFPCCGQKYVGSLEYRDGAVCDSSPPKSPGCRSGRHTPEFYFRQTSR